MHSPDSIRHARVALPGIYDFKDLQAGFPTKTASGMTFCETIKFDGRMKSGQGDPSTCEQWPGKGLSTVIPDLSGDEA
jgi:uncharacterized Zn-binding protein involved in type VI secretion